MLEKLLDFFLPADLLVLYGKPYMKRWYLMHSKRLGGLRIHKIMQSDPGRDLHDHPFSFISIGVKGHYIEECHGRADHYQAPWIRSMPAEGTHRLHLDNTAWTIVLHGPSKREWGFHTSDGWIHWKDYWAEDETELIKL